MPPKITFIIPVFNTEQYLRECLDSVAGQTLREIQIICIDNGSTDGSGKILEEYVGKDDRFLMIHHPEGRQGGARNAAYPHVKGEYIFFVDSDDYIDRDAGRKLYYWARYTGAEIVQFYGKFGSSNPKLVPDSERIPEMPIIDTEEQKKHFLSNTPTALWDKLFSSDLLLKNDIKCAEKLAMQDHSPNFVAIAVAEKIEFLPMRLYTYRMHSSSSVHSYNTRNLADIVGNYMFLYDELVRLGIYEKYKEPYSHMKLKWFYRCFRDMKSVSIKERIEIFRPNISRDDIGYFEANRHLFRKNERNILSGIIEGRLSQTVETLRMCLLHFDPIFRSLKNALEKFRYGKKFKIQQREIERLKNQNEIFCEKICRVSMELDGLKVESQINT